MMSKRRSTLYEPQTNPTPQVDIFGMFIPGMIMAILAFFALVNWISAPTGSVQAAAGQGAVSSDTTIQPPESVEEASAVEAGECSIGSRYPQSIRQWCGLIEEAAARYGLEPDLLAAVMLQESGGDAQAYSASGAVGLMQVMPRDGIAAGFMCQNGPCFSRRPTMDELFDPAFNVDYSTRMLAALIGRTGSLREALLAYGPMDIGYRYADLVLTIMNNYR
jgi:soluble lytic murein transglycosylase-like protein